MNDNQLALVIAKSKYKGTFKATRHTEALVLH